MGGDSLAERLRAEAAQAMLMIVTGNPAMQPLPMLLEEAACALEEPPPMRAPVWVLAKREDVATWPPHKARIIMCARARGVGEDTVVTAWHVAVQTSTGEDLAPYVALQGARLLRAWGYLADEDDAWSLHWQFWVPPF